MFEGEGPCGLMWTVGRAALVSLRMIPIGVVLATAACQPSTQTESETARSAVTPESPLDKRFQDRGLLAKYTLLKRDQWTLNTGGTNFYYSFADSGNDRAVSVEMGPSADNITTMGISWNGQSTLQPARLTMTRQQFLRDLLQALFPDASGDDVVSLVEVEQSRNYPDGSNTMPRKKVGAFGVYAGTVGESLVVGIEK